MVKMYVCSLEDFYRKVVAYKKKGIRVSLAIGGWNDSLGDKYSRLVNSPAARSRFVQHVVKFLKEYDFDGLDFDWEYPKCWQVNCASGPASDKQGFADLVKELRAAFRPHGWLLSAAVSPSKVVIDEGTSAFRFVEPTGKEFRTVSPPNADEVFVQLFKSLD